MRGYVTKRQGSIELPAEVCVTIANINPPLVAPLVKSTEIGK